MTRTKNERRICDGKVLLYQKTTVGHDGWFARIPKIDARGYTHHRLGRKYGAGCYLAAMLSLFWAAVWPQKKCRVARASAAFSRIDGRKSVRALGREGCPRFSTVKICWATHHDDAQFSGEACKHQHTQTCLQTHSHYVTMQHGITRPNSNPVRTHPSDRNSVGMVRAQSQRHVHRYWNFACGVCVVRCLDVAGQVRPDTQAARDVSRQRQSYFISLFCLSSRSTVSARNTE